MSYFFLRCLKNCPPVSQKTNSKEPMILRAVCIKRCKDLSNDLYEWSINIPNFNYDSNTRNGRNTDVFHINKNVLEDGKKYIISVAVKGMVVYSA